ncbi:LamG-like jellyroll fold domain-containing protein [Chitinophaga caseinilytica]|uniref:LamG-like jellyroll fold domain-containing protein n=1 Tax=Chitinophaga caseinilytica TaxID=2267521 RepID=A0ABZ2Z498_9BACT
MKHSRYLFFCLAALLMAACKKDDDPNDTVIREVVFESDKQEISAGDSIVFKDFTDGYVTHWQWNFQGGQPESSTLSAPKVIYSQPGTYEVTLEVKNAHTQKSITRKAYIKVDYNRVRADFKTAAAVYFQHEDVKFRDTSAGKPQTWAWEFTPLKGGATLRSTQQHPVMKFADTGYYRVSLTASNPQFTDQVVKENFIRILDPASISADFTSDQPATYAGGKIKLKDVSMGAVTGWEWTISGPEAHASTDQNPEFTFTLPGRYKVSLKVSNPYNSHVKTMDKFLLVIPSGNLSAFVPFNHSAIDAGPNGIAMSAVGGGVAFGQDRFGGTGLSATFNGASGVLLADHAATNFGADDYTVSLWVKTGSNSKMMLWQESGRNGSKDNQTWIRLNDNTSDRRMRFCIEDGVGSTFVNLGAAGNVSDDAWHHVVAVRSGTTTAVYVDGVKVGSATAPALRTVSNGQDFKIGFQEGAAANSSYFSGQLDDVIIYRKALTDAEVLALYQL